MKFFLFVVFLCLPLTANAVVPIGPSKYMGGPCVNSCKDDIPFDEALQRAEDGEPSAQAYVGYYFFLGRGTEKNKTTALNWWLRAAKQDVYYSMDSVADEYAEQHDWENSYFWSAVLLERQGFNNDKKKWTPYLTEQQKQALDQKARIWRPTFEKPIYIRNLEIKATDGDIKSQMALSQLFSQRYFGVELGGTGIAFAPDKARYWNKLAADQGNAGAQIMMETPDPAEIYYWEKLARKNGYPNWYATSHSLDPLQKAAEKLSLEQIKELDKKVATWKPVLKPQHPLPIETLESLEQQIQQVSTERQKKIEERKISDALFLNYKKLTDIPTPTNDAELKSTLTKAEKGDISAQYSLGQYYFSTQAVTIKYDDKGFTNLADSRQLHLDFKAALQWYLRAANQGYVPAQDALVELYDTESPIKNLTEAYFWTLIVLKSEYKNVFGLLVASAFLDQGKTLPLADREWAEKRFKEWKPTLE